MELSLGRLPNPNFKVFFITISRTLAPRKLIFGMQIAFNKLNEILRRKLKIFCGRLPNPNFNVFFIAISIIKQARRLIFGMQLDFNLTSRRNIEEELILCCVHLP